MSEDDREDPSSNVRDFKSIPGGKPKMPPELEHFAELMPQLKMILESFGMPKPPTPEKRRAKEEHVAWERFALASLGGGNSHVTAIVHANELLDEWKKRRPEVG